MTSEYDKVIFSYFPASSYRMDNSFSMCVFRDDDPPLRNMIRSEAMKSLLREYA